MNSATPTLAQALAQAHTLGLARIDAQLLLLHTLARPDAGRAWLLAHDTDAMDETAHGQFMALCQRRLAGEPVAYLTGRKEFYGLPLQVDARVLDPRPDTETLVDWALELIAPLASPRVVDLGTGSGAIALALQSQRADAQVLAVDASADALAVAQANGARLGLPVQFQPANWLTGVEGLFDAIVSNPPTSPAPTRTWPRSRTNRCRPWPVAQTGSTISAPSLPRRPPTCSPAAGCCWNMATTRQTRYRRCWPPTALPRYKAAMTSLALRVARAGSGHQGVPPFNFPTRWLRNADGCAKDGLPIAGYWQAARQSRRRIA